MIPWTDLHCFNVHNDGYFLHSPLRYVNGVIFEISVARMAYESFAKFLEAKSGNYFQDMDLSEYLGQADTTKMDACVSKTIYPPKKRYCNDFFMDEMVHWVETEVEQHGGSSQHPQKIDKYDSDRSVDYLSLCEEESIELRNRMKANIENKAKGNSVLDINEPNAENNMPVDTTRGETLVEHDIYINELLTRLKTTNENGKTQDPFISIEKHADKLVKKKTVEEHYALLRSYEKIVLDSNHGFTIKLGVIVNPDGKTYFDRFYVCFVGLADGWKAGCRKVIELDGCFLRSRNQGEILTAIRRDGNNHIYSMAWAVVNAENKDN
ncbi:hypothetical protein Tco_1241647 [Tanacetum coccineum]